MYLSLWRHLPGELDDKASRTRLLALLLRAMLLVVLPRLRRATAANDSSRLTVCSMLLGRLGTLTLMGLEGTVRGCAFEFFMESVWLEPVLL